MSLLLGHSIVPDLMGIAAGHTFYFLTKLYPEMEGGFNPLETPEWFRDLLARGGIFGGG